MAWNIGEIIASTLPNYEKSFEDQVFQKTVMLDHMKANGGVSRKGGGYELRVPLMIAKGQAEYFSGTKQLNVAPVETLDAAVYQWRNVNVPITVTLDEELANEGEEQVIDLVEAKIQQAQLTIADQINADLIKGTGAEADPHILGLSTAAGTGLYGGIDGTTYTDWQAYVHSNAGALMLAHIRTARNTVNKGKGGSAVSMIITTQTLYEKIEALYTPTFQMNPMVTSKEAQRLADGGFTALAYAGVPISYDDEVTAGEVLGFNTTNYKFYIHNKANFTKTQKRMPTDQHVSVQHIVARIAAGSNRRASIFKLSGKTA
jgi:hypothetical protein